MFHNISYLSDRVILFGNKHMISNSVVIVIVFILLFSIYTFHLLSFKALSMFSGKPFTVPNFTGGLVLTLYC